MLEDGFDVAPLVEFMHNLMKNPSKRAVDELYGFLEKNSLPITPDGCFLAYKRVRGDYKDCYTGTMDNSVGKVVEMERNMVDDNRDNTCSTGLHFCSHSYLASFGGERTVIVKVNPADVVSIPSDYNNAKGRACSYEVIGEIGNDGDQIDTAFNKPVQSNASNNIAKPVVSEPKTGSTEFYRGYTDGFEGNDYTSGARYNKNYDEGYDKGQLAREDGNSPRYQYIAPNVTAMANGVWPFPNR
jgi:hypothetical protein